MKGVNSTLVLVAPLLLAVIFSDLVACKKAKKSDPPKGTCKTVTNSSCPDGLSEIYTEEETTTDYDDDDIINTNKQCCTTGSQKEWKEKIKAVGCQISKCLDSSTDASTLCDVSLNKRWVDGKLMEYEEVMYDTCEKHKHKLGTEALCCPQNSKEGMLTLLLGAEKHQFPHFATVKTRSGDGVGICSGTIYNERHIITASHCMLEDGKMADAATAYVETDVQIAGWHNAKTYKVEKFIPHEESTMWTGESPIFNDIGIVRLAEDIIFDDNVKALPIAPTGFDPFKYSEEAILIGVGDTDTMLRANLLQRANVFLRSDEVNIKHGGPWHKYKNKDPGALLFVGGIQEGKISPRSAPGDSGGPAICRGEDGNALLCGLDSNGYDIKKCETYLNSTYCPPTTYMEVQYYYDWIISNAGDQSNADVLQQPLYGAPVPEKDYEHQVHIVTNVGNNKEQTCGGTLIGKDLVLTAAHCVADDDGNPQKDISVMTGVRNVNTRKSGKKYDVAGVQVLDGFKKGESSQKAKRIAKLTTDPSPKFPYYKNDLALVKLTKRVRISSKKLAKVGKAVKSASDDAVWHTEVSLPLKSTRPGDGALQQRDFKLLHNDVCQKRMDRAKFAKYEVKVDENIMCGEEKYNGGSQCDRDLGGGLMCVDNNGDEVLCGVQVFRFCQLALPSAFLDISLYEDWIETAKSKF